MEQQPMPMQTEPSAETVQTAEQVTPAQRSTGSLAGNYTQRDIPLQAFEKAFQLTV